MALRYAARRYLAGSEDSGEAKDTGVFHVTNRTYLCPSRNHYQVLATTASAMADGGEDPTALWRSPAM